jgi:hypothetical protein
LTGTLERFPRLKIVLVEPGLYWVAGFLASLDRKAAGPYSFPGMKLTPSEYFHRNMAVTFMDDEFGLTLELRIFFGPRTSRTRRPLGPTRRRWSSASSPKFQRGSGTSSALGTPLGCMDSSGSVD